MNFKQLLKDDDAVSPVIGVILMVAITVILAAVIGTFVLGLGDQVQQTSPTAQFSFDFDADSGTDGGALDITHDGGDGIEASQLSVSGDINSTGDIGPGDAWSDNGYGANSQVTAGNSITVHVDPSSADSTVNVIWQAPDGDRSSTLADWEQ
jgi:flagellin-like protein